MKIIVCSENEKDIESVEKISRIINMILPQYIDGLTLGKPYTIHANDEKDEYTDFNIKKSLRRVSTDWVNIGSTSHDQGYCPDTGGSCHHWCLTCPYD